MIRQNPELSRPAWLRYGFAIAASAVSLAATWAFYPVLHATPFLLGFVAVLAAGWFGGGGPSFAATLLVAGGTLFLIPSPHAPVITSADDFFRLLLFVGAGGLASLLQRQLWLSRRGLFLALDQSRRSRQVAEDAMIELARFAAIVESSDDAIVEKDLDGNVTAWNAAAERLFGYKAEEMIGHPISKLMTEGHKHDMREILSRIGRGERVQHFETVRLRKDGSEVAVSLSVSPVKDPSGRVVGAAKIARDVSERKGLEAERESLLREAQRAIEIRDAFLSVAGHEFRTPLAALSLMFHNWGLRARTENDPRTVERVEKARQQVERLVRLTEDLLDIGRISAGRLELRREPTDLAALVREAAERMEGSAARSGSPVQIDAPRPVMGDWDRSRLDQVVTNLLTNAVKFGPGQPILVRVGRENGLAELSVRDRGIGIAAADQERIFERFERAVSERSYSGIGLGLWIARQLVNAHGGSITVESEPGRGSTFRVRLPPEAA
ncbi:MAG: PAS domain S-box protein [Acidobacteriota bacterium]